MDKRAIIAAYARAEAEAGGLANACPRQCTERAATECGVTYQDAREVLINHWARRG
jgi:predicted SPOUT superfamily RNA methylase MTH1